MKTIFLILSFSFLIVGKMNAQTKDSSDNEDYYDHSPDEDSVISGEFMPVRKALYNETRWAFIKSQNENPSNAVEAPKDSMITRKNSSSKSPSRKLAQNQKSKNNLRESPTICLSKKSNNRLDE